MYNVTFITIFALKNYIRLEILKKKKKKSKQTFLLKKAKIFPCFLILPLFNFLTKEFLSTLTNKQ